MKDETHVNWVQWGRKEQAVHGPLLACSQRVIPSILLHDRTWSPHGACMYSRSHRLLGSSCVLQCFQDCMDLMDLAVHQLYHGWTDWQADTARQAAWHAYPWSLRPPICLQPDLLTAWSHATLNPSRAFFLDGKGLDLFSNKATQLNVRPSESSSSPFRSSENALEFCVFCDYSVPWGHKSPGTE